MKVLLIDVNCKYSSTGKIVYDLYSNLNNQGHTAAICYGRGPLVKGQKIHKFSSNIETYIHAFLTRVTGLTGIYSPIATLNLIRFIKKFKPDVVHLHELHAYFVNIAPIINYLKKNNIKTVWTFHCEFMYTGKCGHAYECKRWKVECHNCPQLREYPKSWFFDFTKKMFNDKKRLFTGFDNLIIVTPSKWLADRVEKSFLKEKHIEVVNNGIDTGSIFYPRDFSNLKKKHNLTNEKIVLAVAPDIMSESKGGEWVLKLAKQFIGKEVKFILIGVNDLNQQFDGNVIALGRTENQVELAEYYSMADVFLICSKRENFPTTCLEAISCGTPVCGFDEGGTKETAPGDIGSFVAYGDLKNLEIKVTAAINKKDIHKGEYSLYGLEHYSIQRMYKDYLRLYKR